MIISAAVDAFSEEEKAAYEAFRKKHRHKGKRAVTSILLTPTGIGDGIRLICSHCKAEQDITDYSGW